MAKKETKRSKTIANIFKNPTSKSERIVVDEIIDGDDGKTKVRLLRAKRSKNSAPIDMSIKAWNSESEYFMEAWQLEAFVGLPTGRKLREGDVFFITNGAKLDKYYGTKRSKLYKKPLPRAVAEKIHLLSPEAKSREIARTEIKKQFSRLSACKMTSDKKEIETLLKAVEDKFKENAPVAIKKGGK